MGAMVENEDGEAFNYAVLAPNVAVAARRNARLIVEDEERARANAVLSIMKVGQWLTEIKEQLEHGQFLEWTQAEFRWSDRTAQRYMLASSVFGSNPTPVSYLPPAVVYQLSSPSTPEPVRDDVVHNSQAGNQLPPDEVRYRIKEAKAAERKASENAKLTKGQKKYRKRVLRDHEAEAAERAAERERRSDAAARAVAMVVEHFGDKADAFFALLKEAGGFEFERAIQAET